MKFPLKTFLLPSPLGSRSSKKDTTLCPGAVGPKVLPATSESRNLECGMRGDLFVGALVR